MQELMYGMSDFSLYKKLDEEEAVDENGDPITKEKAREYYDKYFDTYKGVAEFITNQKRYAHKYGEVYTLLGRKRRLPDINSHNYKKVGYEERLSVNAPIQGSTADIMMYIQPKVEADERLQKMGCTMRLQVYDEIVFNCKKKYKDEAMAIIKEYMENPLPKPLNVPLRFEMDFGETYAEAK